VRTFLIVVAIAALAVAPAYAIDYSSTIADWEAAGLLHTDIYDGSNSSTSSYPVELQKWGITVDADNLIAIMLNGKNMDTYDTFFAGVSINADGVLATKLSNMSGFGTDAWDGTDIHIEWGKDRPGLDPAKGEGWNLWGINHDYAQYTAVINGACKLISTNTTNDTIVLQVAKSELANQTAAFNAVSGGGNGATMNWPTMVAGVRLAGHMAGGDWLADLGGSGTMIPEPGSVAMLIGAGLAALAYALRRRQ
jgi:hypothetical protein